ncbi:MAG: hypothetical protein IKS59_04355 [Aeriscardovia sp.]|nr:hypothetical protein [Aeriscardovia sp.]
MVDYDSAAQAVQDKNADPAFLALIAYENPDFGPNVAAHPRAYPGLLAWLAKFGSPEAKRIVAQRISGLPINASILEREPRNPSQLATLSSEIKEQSSSSSPSLESVKKDDDAKSDVNVSFQSSQPVERIEPEEKNTVQQLSNVNKETDNAATSENSDKREVSSDTNTRETIDTPHDKESTGDDASQQLVDLNSIEVNGYTAAQAIDPDTPLMMQHDIAQDAPELRPYLARNPNLYSELLTWLQSLDNPQINQALKER